MRRANTTTKFRYSLLAAALLASGWCAQAAASSTDIICDQTSRHSVSLDIPVNELTVNTVDHGAANTISTDESLLDSRDQIDPSVTPRVAAVLRQIFDESLAQRPLKDRLNSPAIESLQDLVESLPVRDEPETAAPAAGDMAEADSSAPDVNARLPGVEDEQSIRYRREMYRTDI